MAHHSSAVWKVCAVLLLVLVKPVICVSPREQDRTRKVSSVEWREPTDVLPQSAAEPSHSDESLSQQHVSSTLSTNQGNSRSLYLRGIQSTSSLKSSGGDVIHEVHNFIRSYRETPIEYWSTEQLIVLGLAIFFLCCCIMPMCQRRRRYYRRTYYNGGYQYVGPATSMENSRSVVYAEEPRMRPPCIDMMWALCCFECCCRDNRDFDCCDLCCCLVCYELCCGGGRL
jgi:hypothetical protein